MEARSHVHCLTNHVVLGAEATLIINVKAVRSYAAPGSIIRDSSSNCSLLVAMLDSRDF